MYAYQDHTMTSCAARTSPLKYGALLFPRSASVAWASLELHTTTVLLSNVISRANVANIRGFDPLSDTDHVFCRRKTPALAHTPDMYFRIPDDWATSPGGIAANQAFDNDIILYEVYQYLHDFDGGSNRYEKAGRHLQKLFTLSKRSFFVAVAIRYRSVKTDILQTLIAKDCSFVSTGVPRSRSCFADTGVQIIQTRLQTYLTAVRTVVLPADQPVWPTEVKIPHIQLQFPHLLEIRFVVPGCKGYSSIRLYDKPEKGSGEDDSTVAKQKDKVVGKLDLVLDTHAGGDIEVSSGNIGVVGESAIFHSAGLVLGNAYPRKSGVFNPVRAKWKHPMKPISAVFAEPDMSEEQRQKANKQYWQVLFRHLEKLVVCCGIFASDLGRMASAAPYLHTLELLIRSNPDGCYGIAEDDESPDLSDDSVEKAMYEPDKQWQADAVLRRFSDQYARPSQYLQRVALLTDFSGLYHLSDMEDYLLANNCILGWRIEELEDTGSSGTPFSLLDWQERYHHVSQAQKRLRYLELLDAGELRAQSPLATALLIHHTFGPTLPITFPDNTAETARGMGWLVQYHTARLFLIEMERKAEPRGYRLIAAESPTSQTSKVDQE